MVVLDVELVTAADDLMAFAGCDRLGFCPAIPSRYKPRSSILSIEDYQDSEVGTEILEDRENRCRCWVKGVQARSRDKLPTMSDTDVGHKSVVDYTYLSAESSTLNQGVCFSLLR